MITTMNYGRETCKYITNKCEEGGLTPMQDKRTMSISRSRTQINGSLGGERKVAVMIKRK